MQASKAGPNARQEQTNIIKTAVMVVAVTPGGHKKYFAAFDLYNFEVLSRFLFTL